MPEFSGKVAIVTGAARGLGAAFARSLAHRGAKVALFDLLEKEAKAVASDIVTAGGEAEAYAVDVASQASFRSAVDKVAERFGGIDILINNAGLGTTEDTKGKSWLDWPQSALEKVFAVNMGGTFYGCQAVVPHMRKRGRGKIVNVSSATYWSPIAEAAHYVAAKGGVIGLTRALAKGLGKDAITVNVLVPGLGTLNRDGGALSYTVHGAGRAVVFLHGFTATNRLWEAQVAAFEDRCQVICLEQRGHGASDSFPAGGYTLDAMAGDVIALLEAEKLSDAVVVGHSMGGMVAQVLAARFPARLRAVAYSSTTCFGPARAHFEPIVATAIGLTAATTGDAAADPIMRALKPITEVTARACGEMMMGMGDLSAPLVGSPVKTLVIHGDQDSKGIVAAGERFAAILPNATRTVIPGAGHVPQISHVSVYNEALGRFLDAA